MTVDTAAAVELDDDPFDPAILLDRLPFDTRVRESAPVVRLSRYGVWATGRYELAERAFRDWTVFSSAAGTGLAHLRREPGWRAPSPVLDVDPPEHDAARAVMARVLSPRVVRRLHEEFRQKAEQMVGALVERGEFDAARDLAQAYPLSVFPDAVGLSPEGREHILPYSNLNFQAMGPRNELYHRAVAEAAEAVEYVTWQVRREALAEDGIGMQVYAAADAGEITEEEAALLVRSFIGAGVDTTIYSIGLAIHALLSHPDQWALLHADPGLARAAFEETLRYTTPGPVTGRTTRVPVELDGVRIDADEKVLIFVNAANRDPRRWENPDVFDIRRKASGHLTFGKGVHACVGQMMARMEAECVLTALAERVRRLEPAGEPVPKLSNWLRGFESLPVRVVPV